MSDTPTSPSSPSSSPPPSPHLSLTPYTTPTSAETILTRLLPSHPPDYRIPPETALTRTQRAFLTDGFSTLPPSLDPTGTSPSHPHNQARYTRKRTQIISIFRHLIPLLPEKGAILDACCGTGHVGLVLAYLLPEFRVTLLDRSKLGLKIARGRAERAGLTNIAFSEGVIEDFADRYDALVALHACGGASDACLSSILTRPAVGCVIPCCTGGSVTDRGRVTGRAREAVVHDPRRNAPLKWGLARSDSFRDALGRSEYEELARCADGVNGVGGVAKGLLEMDRVTWVRECGRECWLGKVGGGIKDDVIVISRDVGAAWKRDLMAAGNGVDFLEGRMEHVKQVLTEVVIGKRERFVAGGGRSARKVVHGAADCLGLRHWSEGKGKDRVVIVAPDENLGKEDKKRGGGEIYYRGYIGACSESMSKLAREVSKHVPEEYITQKENLRGTEHHVTLFNAREVRALSRELVSTAAESLRGSEIIVHGVGRVSSSIGWEPQEEATEETYFIVLDWPALQTLREAHGLPRSDVHITLGFRTSDIHDVTKDIGSVVVPHNTRFTF